MGTHVADDGGLVKDGRGADGEDSGLELAPSPEGHVEVSNHEEIQHDQQHAREHPGMIDREPDDDVANPAPVHYVPLTTSEQRPL